MEKLYLFIILTACVALFFKPIIGVIAIILVFSLETQLLFPIHLEYRLTVVIGAAFLLSTAFRGFPGTNRDGFSLIIGFIVICAISTILNGNLDSSDLLWLLELYKNLGFVLLIFGSKFKKNDLVLVLLVFVIGGVANAVMGLLQQSAYVGEGVSRSTGFMEKPNAAALIIYMPIPFAYFFYAQTKTKIVKIAFMAAMIVLILGVISTGSRAGMLTTMLICGMLFIKNIKRPLTVALIAGIIFFAGDLVRDRFQERSITQKSFSRGESLDSSVQARVDALSGALILWLYNPLFGVGPNNYAKARAEQFGLHGAQAGLSAHNTTLQILAETGIMGMLIFLALILKGFKAIRRTAEDGDEFYKELAANMKIFLIAFCFGTMFVNTFLYEIYWLWLTLPYLLRSACFVDKETTQSSVAG